MSPINLAWLRAQGFDQSQHVAFTSSFRVQCSQCEAACINGIPCHETGCPNLRKHEKEEEED